jgi:hypothetical protein
MSALSREVWEPFKHTHFSRGMAEIVRVAASGTPACLAA